jgi:hypothetical protein
VAKYLRVRTKPDKTQVKITAAGAFIRPKNGVRLSENDGSDAPKVPYRDGKNEMVVCPSKMTTTAMPRSASSDPSRAGLVDGLI